MLQRTLRKDAEPDPAAKCNTEREKDPMQYKYASVDDMELLIRSRAETLRAVNRLPEDYAFSEEFLEASREYFREGDQTTVLALAEGRVAGCATMCYIDMMPTFSHPSGRRGHLMNVYTHPDFRRQGVGRRMVSLLIDEARNRGISEISLDATEAGRPLYESLGFRGSDECMVLELKQE